MADELNKKSSQFAFSLPIALMIGGILLIAASFFPLGQLAAQAQWTPEDSAAYDRVSQEFKQSAYESPARRGVDAAEWQAQRDKMEQKMRAMQQRLERAKSQPERWSRYLLGTGVLLTVAGFYANATGRG